MGATGRQATANALNVVNGRYGTEPGVKAYSHGCTMPPAPREMAERSDVCPPRRHPHEIRKLPRGGFARGERHRVRRKLRCLWAGPRSARAGRRRATCRRRGASRRHEARRRDGSSVVAGRQRPLRMVFHHWAAEKAEHRREVIEAALAHAVGNKVEAAYARSDMFECRRRLMDDSAAQLDGLHRAGDSLHR